MTLRFENKHQFNSKSITKDNKTNYKYYAQKEVEYDSDEYGEYNEVEKLVQDPDREQKERNRFDSQDSSSTASVQNVPNVSFTNEHKELFQEETVWKEKSIEIFYAIMKPITFVLFMIYWIMKEPVIRTVTFITIIISSIIVNPAFFLWTRISYKPIIRFEEKKKVATQWLTTIITIYIASSVINRLLWPSPTENITKYKHQDLSKIYERLTHLDKMLKDNSNAITLLKKDTDENWKVLSGYEQEKVTIWKSFSEQQDEYQQVKNLIENHQHQLELNQEEIRQLTSSLSNMISDHTHSSNDQLELSSQIYNYLSSEEFLHGFITRNKKSISNYLKGELELLLNQQENQDTLVSKDITDLISKFKMDDNNSLIVKELFESLVNHYHQDVINIADFALASRGGRILYSKTSPTYESLPSWYGQLRRSMGLNTYQYLPDMVIIPNVHVGECWRMKGSEGSIGILLSQPVIIKGVTIDHPSTQVLLDEINGAPKDLQLYGISGYGTAAESLVLLCELRYSIYNKNSIQTFNIDPQQQRETYRAVFIQVKSNWGNQKFTDIYRIRIHGIPVHHQA